jgi:thiol-disulfide isomerase/thioredoxin
MKTWHKVVVLICGVLFCMFVGMTLYVKKNIANLHAPLLNTTAPSITNVQVWNSTGAAMVTSIDMTHNITVLHFWSESCSICVAEAPQWQIVYDTIQNFNKTAKTPIHIYNVALAMDENAVDAWQRNNGYSTPTIIDPNGSISIEYALIGTPQDVIIGNGRILTITNNTIDTQSFIGTLENLSLSMN